VFAQKQEIILSDALSNSHFLKREIFDKKNGLFQKRFCVFFFSGLQIRISPPSSL